MSSTPSTSSQTLVGAGVLVIGGVMAFGATSIPSDAGYAGVGPNALPWLVSVVLMLCGGWLVLEARSGGFRDLEAPSGAERGDWRAVAWVVAGVVANAALITTLGFILACGLCMIWYGWENFLHGFGSFRMPSLTPLAWWYLAIPLSGAFVCLFVVEQLVNGWRNGFPARGPQAEDEEKGFHV